MRTENACGRRRSADGVDKQWIGTDVVISQQFVRPFSWQTHSQYASVLNESLCISHRSTTQLRCHFDVCGVAHDMAIFERSFFALFGQRQGGSSIGMEASTRHRFGAIDIAEFSRACRLTHCQRVDMIGRIARLRLGGSLAQNPF